MDALTWAKRRWKPQNWRTYLVLCWLSNVKLRFEVLVTITAKVWAQLSEFNHCWIIKGWLMKIETCNKPRVSGCLICGINANRFQKQLDSSTIREMEAEAIKSKAQELLCEARRDLMTRLRCIGDTKGWCRKSWEAYRHVVKADSCTELRRWSDLDKNAFDPNDEEDSTFSAKCDAINSNSSWFYQKNLAKKKAPSLLRRVQSAQRRRLKAILPKVKHRSCQSTIENDANLEQVRRLACKDVPTLPTRRLEDGVPVEGTSE